MTLGVLSDKYKEKSAYAMPSILVVSSFFFSVFSLLAMYITTDYYASSIFVFSIILLADGWTSGAFFVLKAALPTKIHTVVVSLFFFC